MLTVKEFFDSKGTTAEENSISNRIQKLWEEVEWDWYTKGGESVLYWHWSPNYGWDMRVVCNKWSQSADIAEAAAIAYGKVLKKYGVPNGVVTRLT